MKKKKFKEANRSKGYVCINYKKNSVIMRFKPTFMDRVKIALFLPVSVWVGAPIQAQEGTFDVRVCKSAFIKGTEE